MKTSLRREIRTQAQSSVAQPNSCEGELAKLLSDEFLISRNDLDACITELVRRYSRLIRSIAYGILQDSFEADDVVQEVFLQVQRKRAEFDAARGTVRVWILQIARNVSTSRWRQLNSRRFYSRLNLESVDRLSIDARVGRNELAEVEQGFERTNLRRLFLLLSENQRRTLELFFCEGYTLDEIAAELGQSKGNIRHHYFRGLEKLRKEVFCKKPQPSAV